MWKMARTLMEIKRDIGALSGEDREILLRDLLEEVDPMEPEIEKAWIIEVRRRRDDLLSGRVQGIPFETAMNEIRRSVDERRDSSSARPV